MSRKQLFVVLGAASALAISVATASLALGRGQPGDLETAERLAVAVRFLLIPGLCLLVGVAGMGNHRFFSPAAIDGGRTGDTHAAEINLRYNTNTLEQTVLAAIAWTGLSITLRAEDLPLIPALAVLFGVGRIAFWIGYLMAPWARAFGFGLTAYPTFAALIWLTVQAF
jgi:hypothetical protein